MLNCRILIVDDEEPARERLQRLVLSYSPHFEIEHAYNGIECLEKIASFAPRIIFLDIQMPGMNGIEVIQQLESRSGFRIIFQTAYDDFAIQAFEHSACDYLLKPIRPERLYKALDKALLETDKEDKLMQLTEKFRKNNDYIKSITVKLGNRLSSVPVKDIHYIVVQDDYTSIQIANAEYLTDHSLGNLEKILPPDHFIRCHRSFIVHTPFIDSLQQGRNMNILMKSGVKIPVSRPNRKKLRELF